MQRRRSRRPTRGLGAPIGDYVAVSVVLGTALFFSRANVDVFHAPKFFIVGVAAVGLGAAALYRGLRDGSAAVSTGTHARLAGFFAVAVVAAGLLGGSPPESLFGSFGRYTGLILYLAAVGLFLWGVGHFQASSVLPLLRAMLAAGALISGYGIIQGFGYDPFVWQEGLSGPPSTLGNPNFAAAYVGIIVPIGLWAASTRAEPIWSRASGAAALALAAVYLPMTDAAQGVVVAVAGSAVFGLARSRVGGRWMRWAGRHLFPVVFAAIAGLAGLVILGISRLGDIADVGLVSRWYYYRTAGRVIQDNSVIGIGFGSFDDVFASYRPASHAVGFAWESTNVAHSVPLDMFVSGGAALGLAYLSFVAYVGWTGLRGLTAVGNGRRPLLAAIVAAWLAYQGQSLISIDVPELVVLHWLLAAAIVAIVIPDPPRVVETGFQLRSPLAGGLAVALSVAIAWVVSTPLRADLAANSGLEAVANGDAVAGIAQLERAATLNSWEPIYPALRAVALERLGEGSAAIAAYMEAAERGGHQALYLYEAARLHLDLGDAHAAVGALTRARAVDPHNPDVLRSLGRLLIQTGDGATARAVLEDLVELVPFDEGARELLEAVSDS